MVINIESNRILLMQLSRNIFNKHKPAFNKAGNLLKELIENNCLIENKRENQNDGK